MQAITLYLYGDRGRDFPSLLLYVARTSCHLLARAIWGGIRLGLVGTLMIGAAAPFLLLLPEGP